MKKLILILSLLLCLTLLVACGKDKTEKPDSDEKDPGSTEQNPPETPETPKPVVDFGFYTITNAQGKTLYSPAKKDQGINFELGGTSAEEIEKLSTWTIEPKMSPDGEELIYVLYCTYDPRYEVAEADKLLAGKGEGMIRASYNENNKKQMWVIEKNDDGTFKIISYMNKKFCLVTKEDGNLGVQLVEKAGDEANFTITEKTEFTRFLTFYSKDRKVIFQLPNNTYTAAGITPDRIQQFVEDTVLMYNTYIDFTDFVTYDHIILKAYEEEEHIAYVMSGYICVSADKDFILTDLKKMQERTDKYNVKDINFMMIHEMGHMFDRGQKWSFEGEAMTDIKGAYILYANPTYVAAPSEKDAGTYYNHTNITDAYRSLGGAQMDSNRYSIYHCAAIFVDIIQNEIKDWNKVKEMYHWYSNNIDDIDPIKWYKTKNNLEEDAKVQESFARLEMYIAKLSEYGGVDVRSFITDKDYAGMSGKCNGTIK